MSWYSKDEFEYKFAKRTLTNLELIEKEYRKEKSNGLSDQEICSVYEVTQLINSFTGFLVIPRAEFFDYLPDNISFDKESEAYSVLENIKEGKNKYKYKNTYHKCVKKNIDGKSKLEYYKEYEALTPKTLALRLRNAIAHSRITITPKKGYHDTSITGFVFEDSHTLKGKFINGIFKDTGNEEDRITQKFTVKLSVKEIRILVLSLCDLMLEQFEK